MSDSGSRPRFGDREGGTLSTPNYPITFLSARCAALFGHSSFTIRGPEKHSNFALAAIAREEPCRHQITPVLFCLLCVLLGLRTLRSQSEGLNVGFRFHALCDREGGTLSTPNYPITFLSARCTALVGHSSFTIQGSEKQIRILRLL